MTALICINLPLSDVRREALWLARDSLTKPGKINSLNMLARIFHEGNGISGKYDKEGWANIVKVIAVAMA